MTTDSGERNYFDLLVTACGQLTRPAVAPLAGIDEFEGPVFHSAEWDHEIDLAGRRVAVIGTGASAIQFVPEIAEVAASTAIYQRSAPWILPKSDRLYRAWERRLFRRFPARVAASRAALFAFFELGTYGFTGTGADPGAVSQDRRPGAPPPARRRPGAAGEGDPRLHDRLQARPVHKRLVPGPAPRGRRAGHRRRSSG